MANGRAIKDFYVQIGVEFDSTATKKFEQAMKNLSESIDGVTNSVSELGDQSRRTETTVTNSFNSMFSVAKRATFGIAGLGTASVIAGRKISQGLIDINNLSEQSGASVAQIEKFRRELELAGGSAGEADAFVQGLSEKLAQLKVLGGDAGVFLPQIFQGADQLANPIEALDRIREYLKTASREQRLLVAQELGLSSRALGLLTLPDAEYSKIKEQARATETINREYIEQAKTFNREFAALSTEFRRIQLDLFAGTSEEIKEVVKQLREFLADEDIKTIIIETIKKTSDLFKLLIQGMGGILERISVAGQQLGQGETLGAVKTLTLGTEEQQISRQVGKLGSLNDKQLVRRLNMQSGDLSSVSFNAISDELERRGISGADINLPASLQRMIGLAPSEDKVRQAISSRQQTNNINVTNNFNNSTTRSGEANVLEGQIKQAIANSTREDIN